MLSDEEKEIFNNLKDYMQSNIDNGYHKFIYNDLGWDFKCIDCINAIDKVLKQSKEIEKSKLYWEQIMTKDEMTIEEALTIIDDMYQDKYKIMEQKTDTGVTIDLSKMDEITFTNLEFASVRVLREVQSLNHKLEKLEDKIKAKIEECRKILYSFEKELELKANKEKYIHKESMNCLLSQISILQSLLEKE